MTEPRFILEPTLGVKRYCSPSVAPGRVRPRIKKMVSTKYGKVAVT